RIELRGGKVGVAQHLLHGAKVGAALEQMRGERVAQRVRGYAFTDPRGTGRMLDRAPRTHARKRRPARVQEYPALALPPIKRRPNLAYVQRDRSQRATADGDDTLLRALAE